MERFKIKFNFVCGLKFHKFFYQSACDNVFLSYEECKSFHGNFLQLFLLESFLHFPVYDSVVVELLDLKSFEMLYGNEFNDRAKN